MPTRPIPFPEILQAVQVFHDALEEGYAPGPIKGSPRTAVTEVAIALGFGTGAGSNGAARVVKRLDIAVALNVQVKSWRAVGNGFAANTLRAYRAYDKDFQDAESRLSRPGQARPVKSRAGSGVMPPPAASGQHVGRAPNPPPQPANPTPAPLSVGELAEKVVPALRRGPLSNDELADKLDISVESASFAVVHARNAGANVFFRDGRWHLDEKPMIGSQAEHAFSLMTDRDGYIEFGASGDNHLCSKYERLDCLNDYYDHVAKRGIEVVLNAGNWIDGESSFNRHDITVHGADQQLQYLAKNYPERDGVQTWAIAGEDHEGWYSRREGVDIGRYAESTMRQAGRDDWHNLGFMECFIPLVNSSSGKSSQLCLMHPGGGSAYALSYAPQKIVEGFDGGAKPAVLLIGHYHKASYQMTRNVHVLQTGCFQDQSLFMRQKKLAAHLGGWFCRLHVDPRTGAVDEFTSTFRNYFVKDFYSGRWSEHGPVNHVRRSASPD